MNALFWLITSNIDDDDVHNDNNDDQRIILLQGLKILGRTEAISKNVFN